MLLILTEPTHLLLCYSYKWQKPNIYPGLEIEMFPMNEANLKETIKTRGIQILQTT